MLTLLLSINTTLCAADTERKSESTVSKEWLEVEKLSPGIVAKLRKIHLGQSLTGVEEILKPTQHSVHVDRFSYAYEWYPVNGRVGVFITFIRETENRSEDKVFDRPDKVAYRRNGKQIDVSTAVIYKQTRSSKGRKPRLSKNRNHRPRWIPQSHHSQSSDHPVGNLPTNGQ